MAQNLSTKTILGADCRIKGELHLDGDLELHCQCDGTIHVGGTLDLRESARVQGLARAGAVRVAGIFEGDLVGEQGIALLEGSQVTGRIFAPRLLAVKGATLRAQVCIGPAALNEAPGRATQGKPMATPMPMVEEPAAIPEPALPDFEPVVEAPSIVSEMRKNHDTDDAMESAQSQPAVSVAAALDDADEMNDVVNEEVNTQEPAAPIAAAPEQEADVTTVPNSIRAVLQRRPRLSNLAATARRSA